jgi:uncharacterized repeat protein (TIGR01451 family)
MAEGTAQIGATQRLYEYGFTSPVLTVTDRALSVDIISPGEVINLSLCGSALTDDIRVEIYNPAGTQVLNTTIPNGTFGSATCTYTFSAAALPNPLKYVTATAGTYQIRLFNLKTTSAANTDEASVFRLFDVTVTPNNTTAVTGLELQGRLHANSWAYRAITNDFSQLGSADTDYYVRVPGGRPAENFVWRLDLNDFAGLTYEIVANDIGVNVPNSGFSTPFTGNSITPLHPIFLAYPRIVNPLPTAAATLTNLRFIDSAGQDNTISPGASSTVQDTGTFEFTTDVTGTYSIVIDTNNDGVFSPGGDVYLFGRTTPGLNSVVWDGRSNAGALLPMGTYAVRTQIRVGEYHFVAGDAETSGGTQPGLTIFQALSQTTSADTLVYWDDLTLLGGTTTLPNGALSSTAAARHTWGNFTGSGFGDQRYIDTYVYGGVTQAPTVAILADNDEPVVRLVKRITAINGLATNPNDGTVLSAVVNDGVANSADDAANWPASYLIGAMGGGTVRPGDEIEYTIYFINAANAVVRDVRICDRLLPFQTLVTGAYTGSDVQLRLGTSPVLGLTAANDVGDRTQFIAATSAVPATCNLKGPNDDGTLIVDVTGAAGTGAPNLLALPGSTGPGAPNDTYGFIRFRTRVKP